MAITFLEERKKQRRLVLILTLVIFTILLVVWYGFFMKKETVSPPLPVLIPQKIEIDWQTLKNPQLQEMQPFEEIFPFEEEIGRENPFLQY